MDLAREVDPGTFVVCLEQTAGRGRRGRSWFDGGAGVAATAALEMAEDPLLSTRAGLAMAEAVVPWLGARAGLKWPNDLVVGRRKLGGVLVERRGDRVGVGIGINVDAIERPSALAGVAVSLAELSETPPDRLEVAVSLLRGLERWMPAPPDEVRRGWRGRDRLRGRVVRLLDGRIERRGRVVDIVPDAHVELLLEDGRVVRVPAATARVLDAFADPDDRSGVDPEGPNGR